MAAPAYQSSSAAIAASANNTALTVTYPATVNANDILLLLLWKDVNTTLTVDDPGGGAPFTACGDVVTTSTTFSARLFWRRAVGDEDGATFTCTAGAAGGANNVFGGIVHRFSGCITSGTPFENYAVPVINTASSAAGPNVTVSGNERLALQVWALGDNLTSAPDGAWNESSELTSGTGNDSAEMLDTQSSNAATLTGCTRNWGASNPFACFGLALLPPGATQTPKSAPATATGIAAVGRKFFVVAQNAGASATTAYDSFTRSVSPGWGNADTGQAWTLNSTTAMSVDGANGLLAAPGTTDTVRYMRLGYDPASADYEILYKFQFNEVSKNTVYGFLRTTTGWTVHYGGGYGAGAPGIWTIERGFTDLVTSGVGLPANGEWWWVRFRVVGYVLSLRVWKDGDSEPGTWKLTYDDSASGSKITDAGRPGAFLEAHTGHAANNLYITEFDVIEATGAAPVAAVGVAAVTYLKLKPVAATATAAGVAAKGERAGKPASAAAIGVAASRQLKSLTSKPAATAIAVPAARRAVGGIKSASAIGVARAIATVRLARTSVGLGVTAPATVTPTYGTVTTPKEAPATAIGVATFTRAVGRTSGATASGLPKSIWAISRALQAAAVGVALARRGITKFELEAETQPVARRVLAVARRFPATALGVVVQRLQMGLLRAATAVGLGSKLEQVLLRRDTVEQPLPGATPVYVPAPAGETPVSAPATATGVARQSLLAVYLVRSATPAVGVAQQVKSINSGKSATGIGLSQRMLAMRLGRALVSTPTPASVQAIPYLKSFSATALGVPEATFRFVVTVFADATAAGAPQLRNRAVAKVNSVLAQGALRVQRGIGWTFGDAAIGMLHRGWDIAWKQPVVAQGVAAADDAERWLRGPYAAVAAGVAAPAIVTKIPYSPPVEGGEVIGVDNTLLVRAGRFTIRRAA